MSDKYVRYGISKLHVGTYDDEGATLGAGYHVPGSISMSIEPTAEITKMFADNDVFWTGCFSAGFSGQIENALLSNEFKVTYLGYEELAYNGVAQVMGVKARPLWMAFETDGTSPRRIIFYNVKLGSITREFSTEEDATEPKSSTLPFICIGNDDTTITMASFGEGDAYFNDIFTDPPLPDDLAHFPLEDEDGIELLTDDGDVILGRIDLDDMIGIQDDERDQWNANLLNG